MKTSVPLLYVCLLMSLKVAAQTPVITRGPYLQMASPERILPDGNLQRAAITIRWRTNIPTKGYVRYSTDPEFGPGVQSPFLTGIGTDNNSGTDHTVYLSSLRSDTKYYYRVYSENPNAFLEGGNQHFFVTPPPPGVKKKTKMWVLGDFGAYKYDVFNTLQDQVNASMKNYMTANDIETMDLWLWLGDNAYEQGTEAQYQDNIFHKGRARYDWAFRNTPFYATPGNHDYYDGALSPIHRDDVVRVQKKIHYYEVVNNFKNGEAGGEPSGTEEYYSFDYSNIHFISLDTYGLEKIGDNDYRLNSETVQYKWLERDLKKAQANPDINWIIVFTHMPPYSGGSHDSDTSTDLIPIRKNLVPLLDNYKVDLVLAGHSHDYQRTRLMRKHYDESKTFNAATHLPAVGSNARGSGKYDGSPNSCFYYKTSAATQNEGIVYAVAGAGGKPWGATDSWDQSIVCPTEAYCEDKTIAVRTNQGGSMYIEVDNKKLTARYIGTGGQVLDQFVIFKDLESFTVPTTNGTTRTATCECTETINEATSLFTHYTDNSGNLLLSIKKNKIDIGRVGVAPFEVKVGGVQGRTNVGAYNNPFQTQNYVRSDQMRTISSKWRVMNRYWAIKPASELTGNQQVTVRHYYNSDDFASLDMTDPNEKLWPSYLKFYKVNSLSKDYNLDPTTGSHSNILGATAYNQDGMWVYDGTSTASTLEYKFGALREGTLLHRPNSDAVYGEFVVGRLRGGGGVGGQAAYNNPQGRKIILYSGDESWRYFARGAAPESQPYSWKEATDVDYFRDPSVEAKWGDDGKGPFGYSPDRKDGEKTLIPSCSAELDCYVARGDRSAFKTGCLTTSCSTRWITSYFRTTVFRYTADPVYKSILINYKRDDGAIIYINGIELLPRDPNMPEGTITNTTPAKGEAMEQQWITIVVPNDGKYFKTGNNLVAVELHQYSPDYSKDDDAHFEIEIALSPDVSSSSTRLPALEEAILIEPVTALYPNPTDQGKVYFSEPVPYETVRITDARGVVLRYLSEPGILKELDISPLPAGTFILSSQFGGKVSHYKLVKK